MEKRVTRVAEVRFIDAVEVVPDTAVFLEALDDELGPQPGLGMGVMIGVLGIRHAVEVTLRLGLDLRGPFVEFRQSLGGDVEFFRTGQALGTEQVLRATSTWPVGRASLPADRSTKWEPYAQQVAASRGASSQIGRTCQIRPR